VNTWVCLLKAVNLGKSRRLPMAALREVLQDSGMSRVRTYLQSGNVIADSDIQTEASISDFISDVIASRFKMNVPVFARRPDELRELIRLNPFAENAAQSPTLVRVFFLSEAPSAHQVKLLSSESRLRCDWQVSGRNVYLSYRSAEEYQAGSTPYIAKNLCVDGTERNWRTVSALAKMCS
jgi:uncharacterized protein (DUF1697 family)